MLLLAIGVGIMRIRQINYLMIGSLLLLTISLVLTVNWGLGRLQQTAATTEHYYYLRSQVNDDILQAIDRYLQSGDGLLLSAAETAVGEFIDQHIQGLDVSLQQQVLPIAKGLQLQLGSELRAAGKMAGNSAVLLEQAERNMLLTLDSLSDYANESKDIPKREPYFYLLGKLSRAVASLKQSRSKFFEEQNPALAREIDAKLDDLSALAEQLRQLDLLAIYAETDNDEDDLESLLWGADEQAEPEEKGELLKAELESLINRYPKELSQTRELIVVGTKARASVHKQLASLQDKLSSLEPLVLAERDKVQRQVNLFMLLVCALIVALAIVIFILQYRIASLIEHLDRDLACLAQGDFTKRAVLVTPITELANLLHSYQSLQQSLHEIIVDIAAKSNDIQGASNRMSDSAAEICQLTIAQQQETQQASHAISEVSLSVNNIAEQTVNVSAITKTASDVLTAGQQKSEQSLETIETLNTVINNSSSTLAELQNHAKGINSFVEVIQSIAEQTNLLALNAAIEAARAGEQGRGFSVVADEVRSLAGKTNEATKEIQELISKVSQSASELSTAMQQQFASSEASAATTREAGQVYRELMENVSHINDLIASIVVQTEEQSHIVSEVSLSIESVADKAQVSSKRSEGSLDVSNHLLDISNAFVTLTQRFKV